MAPVRVGLAVPTGSDPGVFRGALRLGRMIGLDCLLLFDHLQDFTPREVWRSPRFTWMTRKQPSPHDQGDPFVVLGSLAKVAGKVRLGVGVTEPLRNHPVTLARAGATLASLTKRAPILGIGAGERMNTEPYGIEFTGQVSKTAEALEIMRRCLSQPGSITYDGDYHHLEDAPFDLTAHVTVPELWVGAHGPRMLDLAARFGDGWMPYFGPSPERYEEAYTQLVTDMHAAGRQRTALTPSLHVGAVLAPSMREAEEVLRTARFVRFNAVTVWPAATWEAVGASHPFGSDYRGFLDVIPEQLDVAMLEESMRDVPPEVLKAGLLWGTPDSIIGEIRQLESAGLRHIAIAPISYPISSRLANYMWWALRRIITELGK